MAYRLSVCDSNWRSLSPPVDMVRDPRCYLGKFDFKDSSKVRTYYRCGFESGTYIVVWDLKHKNYQYLLSAMGT